METKVLVAPDGATCPLQFQAIQSGSKRPSPTDVPGWRNLQGRVSLIIFLLPAALHLTLLSLSRQVFSLLGPFKERTDLASE